MTGSGNYTLTGTVSDTETKCFQSVTVTLQSSSTATGTYSNVATTTTDASGGYTFTRSGLDKGQTIFYRAVTTGYVAGDPHSSSAHVCNNATSNTVSVSRP